MAYNNYGYQGYGAYYQSQPQDQNHTQSPATHTQAYQNSSNPYSQYNHYNTNQYAAAHQSSDRAHQQYQAKSSIDNPGFQQNYYPQQQYSSTTNRNDTSTGYSNYAPTTQTSNAGYGYNTQSTLDQNSKVFQDNSALGNLAYASTLGQRNASTISNASSGSQLYQQQQQQQQSQQQQQQSTPQQQQTQQSSQNQQSSNILPNPTHQQSYTPTTSKSQVTPQISQQPLYRSNVTNQQRPSSTTSQIRRSPSLPGKQNSISQQSSTKVISPHASIMGTTSTRPSVQSSNAHQISTIMNQNENLTTTKANQAPPAQIHTHPQNHIQVDNRSPGTAMQSPAMTEQPTTIDPNAVFDHAEWARKRKAQEDAEAAKRIREHKIPTPLQQQPAVVQPSQTIQSIAPMQATPKTSTPDLAKTGKAKEPLPEDEIRSEMKAFAEKLRTWKSRDPSGTVDEMWRQTLQGTNNSFLLGTRISSQTPQLSRSSVPGKGTPKLDSSGMSQGFDDSGLGSPFQVGTDEMPDLGKFPAMRRRTRADKGVSRSTKAAQVATARAITQSSSPATVGHFSNAAAAGGSVPLDAGAESMRRAMQAFHQTPTPATPDPVTPIPPPKGKSQATAWPEEQKPQLAETAKNFLERQPANQGKQIPAKDILHMLNQNPSYDHLCIMLANKGFAVPRAAFAQELLDIVPSGGSKSSAAAGNSADDTPAKKPRGRPKKNSIVPNAQSPVAPQVANGGPVNWGGNMSKTMSTPDGKIGEIPNGDGAEYASFYEKMRLISGQSPAQAHGTPPQQQQQLKKRNIGELGKGMDMNGGSAGKKQQMDRPGVMKIPRDPKPK